MKTIHIKNLKIGPEQPLVVMAGPCVIESEEHTLRAAEALCKMFLRHGVGLIFKSSYDKANRSSYRSFRGPGVHEGLRILQRVKDACGVPVVTDVHSPEEARAASKVVDLLQIPAFLCRQTDLIEAAARTSVPVSIKKGQFLAPWDMKNVVDKVEAADNHQIILVERGVSFGYNTLVSDMTSIPCMQQFGYPVCFDATHSVQRPGGLGEKSGGERAYIIPLANAALAAGANCLFVEAHPTPSEAKSDAATVLGFDALEKALPHFKALYELTQNVKMNGLF